MAVALVLGPISLQAGNKRGHLIVIDLLARQVQHLQIR
jgi:hypothetical protein